MIYPEYLEEVNRNLNYYPTWRVGQALFNTLYTMDVDLAEQVRATARDPFYKYDWDECTEFLEFVENHCDHS